MVSNNYQGIYWVGSYIRASGLSINAYLILDEYPTLINAGAPVMVDILINKVQRLINLDNLQYIVLNQADIAYAGGLPSLTKLMPHTRIVTSESEAVRLGFYGLYIQPLIIKEGDILQIGRCSLGFYSAPFIGSPNAVFIYERENGVLFSGEAFSTTVSKWRTLTDRDMTELLEAYFDTHIGDSMIARSAIANLKDLPINTIAPGHGPALKKYIPKYIEALSSAYKEAA